MGVLKERSQKALDVEWESQEDDGTQGGDKYSTAITLADTTPRRGERWAEVRRHSERMERTWHCRKLDWRQSETETNIRKV
jgi:hypothetical protein